MSPDKAARIAANAEALYEALRALLLLAEEYEVQIDSEWGSCRGIDEIERDGELAEPIEAARVVLRRVENATDTP